MVVGEALVDLVVAGESVTAAPGGAPYNVARAIGRLDVPVALIAGLSCDRFGEVLEAGLRATGVGLDLLQRGDRPTTLAVAQIDERGAATYTFYAEGPSAPGVTAAALPAETTVLVTGGLGLVFQPMADAIVTMVADLAPATTLVLDVNCRPVAIDDHAAYRRRVLSVAARADVVKASDEDLDELALGPSPIESAQALLTEGAGVVLVTAGAAPTTIVSRAGIREVPVPPADVVDTIGAGDTFTAGFVAWWYVHGDLPPASADLDALATAVRAATAASAVVVTRRGADPPRRTELGAPWT